MFFASAFAVDCMRRKNACQHKDFRISLERGASIYVDEDEHASEGEEHDGGTGVAFSFSGCYLVRHPATATA